MRTRKRVPPAGRKESEAGEHKKWASPRKRQRTDYAPVKRTEEGSNCDHVEEEDEENSEELLPSCGQWDVTCGNKKGILYIKNLERGQEHCIESDGCWFSPSGFEEFGGRGAHKTWKNSITYKNQPLHFWIDCGNLKPTPNKRGTLAASEPSKPKKSHPEESMAKSDHEERVGLEGQPAEASEEQTDVLNGEQTNDITIDIVSIVSQRKPKLILHRLEHLQGDFHLLLNNVVLPQNGSGCMPTEEQSEGEEKTDLSENDTPAPVLESSEPQEETLLHSSDNENEVQCIEYTITTMDKVIGTMSLEEVMDFKDEVEIESSSFQINLELEGEAADTLLDVIMQDSAQQLIERPQEDDACHVLADPPEVARTSVEVDVMEEGTTLDVLIQDSAQQLIERPPQEDDACHVLADPPAEVAHTGTEVDVMEEGTPLDVLIQDSAQQLIERPPQEDDACHVLADPPAEVAHTGTEVDVMEEGTPLDEIIQDSAQLIERPPQEDDACHVFADPPEVAHTGTEMDVIEECTQLDVLIQDSAQQLIERSPQEDNACHVFADPPEVAHTGTEVDVMEECTSLDVLIQDSAQQLIERPLQEDDPDTVLAEPPATENISAKVDVMDLEELKREKLKWQIKVLKLQEEYYSLQLQKLKQ